MNTHIKEKWKKIDIANSHYTISNFGKICSYTRSVPLIISQPIVNGFRQVSFRSNGIRKHFYVHKLVYMYFGKHKYKKYKDIPYITHKNYELDYNFIDNLKVMKTRTLVNNKIRLKYPIYEGNSKTTSKIKDIDIPVIMKKLKKGATLKELATEYNTTDMSISRAKHRGIPLRKRPKVKPKLNDTHAMTVFRLLGKGKSQVKIAKILNVSASVLCRFIKKHQGSIVILNKNEKIL